MAVHINSSFVFHINKESCTIFRVTWMWVNDTFELFWVNYTFNCPIWPLTFRHTGEIINYNLKFNVRFYYPCQLEKSVCRSRFSGIRNLVDLTQFCWIWNTLISTTESLCFCGLQRIPFYLQMFVHESLLQLNAWKDFLIVNHLSDCVDRRAVSWYNCLQSTRKTCLWRHFC